MDPWRAPLSGDVTQAWNPFSWWVRGGQQAGFININASRTDNPELERRIVEEVASYGRQLGRIIEALEVVVSRLPLSDLTPAERDAVRDFTELAEKIARVKEREDPSPLTDAGIDSLVGQLRALERTDPARYAELVRRLQTAFPAADTRSDA